MMKYTPRVRRLSSDEERIGRRRRDRRRQQPHIDCAPRSPVAKHGHIAADAEERRVASSRARHADEQLRLSAKIE